MKNSKENTIRKKIINKYHSSFQWIVWDWNEVLFKKRGEFIVICSEFIIIIVIVIIVFIIVQSLL